MRALTGLIKLETQGHIVVEWASCQGGGLFLAFTSAMKTKGLLSGQPTVFWKLARACPTGDAPLQEKSHDSCPGPCRRVQQNKSPSHTRVYIDNGITNSRYLILTGVVIRLNSA